MSRKTLPIWWGLVFPRGMRSDDNLIICAGRLRSRMTSEAAQNWSAARSATEHNHGR